MIFLLFILATAAGAFIQTTTGFGFGILVMIFYPQLLPSVLMSVTVSGMLSLQTNVVTMLRYFRHIAWKKLLWPMLCYAVVSFAAIRFSMGQADALMKRLLGVMLILLSIWFLFFGKRVRIRPTPAAGLAAGALSGLFSGLFSIGGPPIVVYLLSSAESNEEYMATTQTYFTITSIYALTVRALSGLVTLESLKFAALGILGVAAGVFLGRRVFQRLNADRLRMAVYIFMAAAGVSLLAGL